MLNEVQAEKNGRRLSLSRAFPLAARAEIKSHNSKAKTRSGNKCLIILPL